MRQRFPCLNDDRQLEKGLLAKIIAHIKKPNSRHLALRALTTVTHHGGADICKEISQQAPNLIKLLQITCTQRTWPSRQLRTSSLVLLMNPGNWQASMPKCSSFPSSFLSSPASLTNPVSPHHVLGASCSTADNYRDVILQETR